jgi:tetratricopeptide (TPR) repeat protein
VKRSFSSTPGLLGDLDEPSLMGKVDVDEPMTRRIEGAAATDLGLVPVARVLFDRYVAGASGALLFTRHEIKKIVYFRSGYPISVKSNVRAECLGKILVWDGLISREQWRDSLLVMRESGKRQGSVLIEMGAMTPEHLTRGLDIQFRFRLGELFSWTEGACRFWSGVRPPPEMASSDIAPATLIHEGVRTFMPRESVQQLLAPLLGHFLVPSPNPLWRFQALDVSLKVTLLLDRIDGTTRISDLLKRSPLNEADSLALLYSLLCTRMVTASEVPVKSWASLRLPRIAQSRPKVAPHRTRLGDLAQTVERLRRSLPHEVLGVPPGASLATVRLAFQKRAGERHPDRVGASQSEGLRELAIEALDLTVAAFGKLAPDYDVSAPSAELLVKTTRLKAARPSAGEAAGLVPATEASEAGLATGPMPIAAAPDEGVAAGPVSTAGAARDESLSFDVSEVLAPDGADSPDAFIDQTTFAGPLIRPDQFSTADDTLMPGQPLAEELAEALGALEGFSRTLAPADNQPSEAPTAAPDIVRDITQELEAPVVSDDPQAPPNEARPMRERTLDDRVWQIIEAEQFHQEGLKLLDKGRFDEAVRALTCSVERCEEEGEFRVSLAWAVFQAGLDQESAHRSLEHLDEAAAHAPSARACLFRGHILRFLERRDEAVWAYQEALRHDPENEEAKSELDRIFESSRRS